MSFDYINEAFRKLNMLDEDVFDTSVGGLNNLSNFLDNDDEDIVKVIDPEAETPDALSNSYVGKVILDCNVCHSKIFSEKSDVVLNDDGVVNPEEQCPYCGEVSGFTVVGEIKQFDENSVSDSEDKNSQTEDDVDVEDTTTNGNVEESLTESFEADDDETINELFDVTLDARGFGGSGNNVSVLGGRLPAVESVEDEDILEGIDDTLLTEGKITDVIKKVATRVGADASTIVRCLAELSGSDKLYDVAEYVENKVVLKALLSGNEKVMNTLTKDDIEELQDDISDYERAKAAEKEGKTLKDVGGPAKNKRQLYDVWYEDDEGEKGILSKSLYQKEAEKRAAEYIKERGYKCWVEPSERKPSTDELEEGIFSSFSVLIYNGRGGWEPIAKGVHSAQLSQFRDAHMNRYGGKKDEYKTVTEREAKKLCKDYKVRAKSIPDVEKNMPAWAANFDKAAVAREKERQRGIEAARSHARSQEAKREAEKEYQRKRYNSIKGSSSSNTGHRGISYSGGDYYSESLNEEFDAFTAVSAFLMNKGYDVSSKEGKAYVWGVVDYLDLGNIAPTTENLESWLKDTLAETEYRNELESCCMSSSMEEDVNLDPQLDEAYFRPVEGEVGVKRALIDGCDEFTVTLLEITDEDGVWYEVGINHPTKNFEQVEIGEYRTAEFAENIAQRVISQLTKYVELEELSSIYDSNTRNIYNKVASRMPQTEPTTEELNEDIKNLSLTTDETQVKLTSDENGKVTLVTEPIITEEDDGEDEADSDNLDSAGDLTIAPVSDDTVDEIVDGNDVAIEDEEGTDTDDEEAADTEETGDAEQPEEEDIALDEVDEEGLDELGESYMKNVYENVESFKTTGVSANDTHIVVEGLIKFTSGTERKTGFIFEACTARNNKVNFVGCNEHFSKSRNSFTLDCSVVNKKLLPESLSYNYNINGRKISGTVTRKGV